MKKRAIAVSSIQSRIYMFRGVQVMLDSDLAELYGVETKYLNKATKRNIERFPVDFMFRLSEQEFESLNNLRFQNVTSSSVHGGRRYLPYVFTEQGVAMLSAVLKSSTAVKMSIKIINAFITMRKFISTNAQVFKRLDVLEVKQIETDKKIDTVLDALESKEVHPKQGIFYDGQVFDAYKFTVDLIRTAKKTIIVIDNYVDDSVLTLLSKRKKNVDVTIFTRTISKQLILDVTKFNEQYPPVNIKEFESSHDRFMIIDDKTIYHFGASLKDLGKKWFAFSRMDIGAAKMLAALKLQNVASKDPSLKSQFVTSSISNLKRG